MLFDTRNFADLRRAFPQHRDKIVMLGAMLHPPKASINDPYQRSTAETEHIAAQVDAALAELAKLLGLSPGGGAALGPNAVSDRSAGDGSRPATHRSNVQRLMSRGRRSA